jgi:hypothetical protein
MKWEGELCLGDHDVGWTVQIVGNNTLVGRRDNDDHEHP